MKKRIKKNGAGLSDVSVDVSDDVGDAVSDTVSHAVSDEDEEEERNDFDMIEEKEVAFGPNMDSVALNLK